MNLIKVEKNNFQKKKLFYGYHAVTFKFSHICRCQSAIKKMRVRRSRNVKYLFYKNNAEKNGTFHMQIMLKGGNKHAKIIFETCSLSYQYGHKNSVAYSHFEQLSIISVVSLLLLPFNIYTVSGVLSFSIHYFHGSKYNQWEWSRKNTKIQYFLHQ